MPREAPAAANYLSHPGRDGRAGTTGYDRDGGSPEKTSELPAEIPQVLSSATRCDAGGRDPHLPACGSGGRNRQFREQERLRRPRPRSIGSLKRRRAPSRWTGESAAVLDAPLDDMEQQPQAGASFAALPAAMGELSSYRSWESDFSAWAYRTQTVQIMHSPGFKMTSEPGESEGEFRSRLQLAARERRDEASDKLAGQIRREDRHPPAAASAGRAGRGAGTRTGQEPEDADGDLVRCHPARRFHGTQDHEQRHVGTSHHEHARCEPNHGRTGRHLKRAEQSLAALKQKQTNLETQFQAEVEAMEAKTDSFLNHLSKSRSDPARATSP